MDWIIVSLNSLAILLYIFMIYFLASIQVRVKGKIKKTFSFGLVAIGILALSRALYLLREAKILNIPYIVEGLAVVFSLFLLFGIFNFYKSLKQKTN